MTKHKEMKDFLEKQRSELEEKRKKLENGKGSPDKLKSGKKFSFK